MHMLFLLLFVQFLHSSELLKYDVWKKELMKDENGRYKEAPIGKEKYYLLTTDTSVQIAIFWGMEN